MIKEVITFHSGRYVFSAEISDKTESLLNAVNTVYSIPVLPDSRGRMLDRIAEKSVYNILRLQGSSVTYDQVCRIVAHNRNNFSQDVKSIEAVNTYCAIKYTDEQPGRSISQDIISAINNELSDNLPSTEIGRQYRKGSLFENCGTFLPPASALDINFLLKHLIEWLNSSETSNIHPLLKGILTHLHIFKIQPYKSFNLSTAMVSEIFILKSLGMNSLPYILPQIYSENRQQYEKCVADFISTSSIDSFAEFVCAAVIEKLGSLASDNMDSIRKNTIKSHLDNLLNTKQLIARQHGFLCMILEKNLEFSYDDIQVKKPYTQFYKDVSRTTAYRDIKKFIGMKLLVEHEDRLQFNGNILNY